MANNSRNCLLCGSPCRSFFCEDCAIRIDEERYTKDLKDKQAILYQIRGARRCAFYERVIQKNQDALFNHRVNVYK